MKIEINGITLAYEDRGSGLPLVLIHGFPLNRAMWRPQHQAVTSAGYRLVAPDLRGFGESGTPGSPCSMSTYADDVLALMDHLDIERAVVGGMSMGGYVLMNLLDRHPERITAACFITTRPGCDSDTVKAGRLALLERAKRDGVGALAELFTSTLFAPGTARRKPGLLKELREWMGSLDMVGVEGALRAMLERPDYTAKLAGFTVPSLVIGAEEDRAVRPEVIRALAAGLPSSALCLIPGAGHMANMEKPTIFNDCLLRFLRGVEAADARDR